MGSWANVRLIVVGDAKQVARFRREAAPYLRRAQEDPVRRLRQGRPLEPFDPPDPLFAPDMVRGEGGDLGAEPRQIIEGGQARQRYYFQVKNDNGVEHFAAVSKRFQALTFVVVWGGPDGWWFGSAHIVRGRADALELTHDQCEPIYEGFRPPDDPTPRPDDYDDTWEWEAFDEMMNVAERRWESALRGRTDR